MRRAFALSLLLLACGLGKGKDPYNPGTPLGTFHVTGKLTQSQCGGDLPNPWEFDVKLGRDQSTLYWIQGSVPVQGTLDASGHLSMTDASSTMIHGASKNQGACSITRTDTLNAALPGATADAGAVVDESDVTSFSGALSYAYTIDDGSDCADQIGTTFAALPCIVAYDVTATRTIAPDAGSGDP